MSTAASNAKFKCAGSCEASDSCPLSCPLPLAEKHFLHLCKASWATVSSAVQELDSSLRPVATASR